MVAVRHGEDGRANRMVGVAVAVEVVALSLPYQRQLELRLCSSIGTVAGNFGG